MKIRAIEVEVDGKVVRYNGLLVEQSSWPVVGEKRAETEGTCVCGHLQGEHLPECIYTVEGCECTVYKVKDVLEGV